MQVRYLVGELPAAGTPAPMDDLLFDFSETSQEINTGTYRVPGSFSNSVLNAFSASLV